MPATRGRVRSADGTEIAFERFGRGPALVMVDPAGGWSGFDNIRGLAYDAEISNHMTYDIIRAVQVPTLVLASAGSSDDLTGGTAALVAALPDGMNRAWRGTGTGCQKTCWPRWSRRTSREKRPALTCD